MRQSTLSAMQGNFVTTSKILRGLRLFPAR
jgi:hypothetical protein